MTNPLALNLDTADFDKLVADARALIPQLAPSWTDHNLHDPGIMLLELAAWVADQQIYALARDRLDERRSFSAAMGLRPGGPKPAKGLIWPKPDPASPNPTWPNGLVLHKGSSAGPSGHDGLQFVLEADVALTNAQIAGFEVDAPGVPAQISPPRLPPGGVEPFGDPAVHGARFKVRLNGDLPSAGAGPLVLALGVETDCPAVNDSRARLSASVRANGSDVQTPVLHDGTRGLGQSGLLLIDLSPLAGQPPSGAAVVTLTLTAALRPLPARITRISLNVLPVRQETTPVIPPIIGTGLPNQQVALADGVRFGPDIPPPGVVRLTGAADEVWQAVDDLSAQGPAALVFHFDPAASIIQFGNGVNGAAPAVGDTFQVTCRATQGAQGLIPAGTAWTVQGVIGQFWNPQPTAGGADMEDIIQLRRDTRTHARSLRPIVTDEDLIEAALFAKDLRVSRAVVLDGYEPGACAKQAGMTRTLVVMGADAGAPGSEPAAWLDILSRRIRPHLTLGDRVRIIRPAYVQAKLRASCIPKPGISPAQLQKALDAELASRLRLVAKTEGDPVWVLGLDLHALDVAGWLRRVDGVAALSGVTVGQVNGALGRSVPVPAHGLPVLVREAGDITIGSAA